MYDIWNEDFSLKLDAACEDVPTTLCQAGRSLVAAREHRMNLMNIIEQLENNKPIAMKRDDLVERRFDA